VRPSRQLLRSFLRMRSFLNTIKDFPHAEERPRGASRSTHSRNAAKFLTASKAGIHSSVRTGLAQFLRPCGSRNVPSAGRWIPACTGRRSAVFGRRRSKRRPDRRRDRQRRRARARHPHPRPADDPRAGHGGAAAGVTKRACTIGACGQPRLVSHGRPIRPDFAECIRNCPAETAATLNPTNFCASQSLDHHSRLKRGRNVITGFVTGYMWSLQPTREFCCRLAAESTSL
jgi:hypothetical protein